MSPLKTTNEPVGKAGEDALGRPTLSLTLAEASGPEAAHQTETAPQSSQSPTDTARVNDTGNISTPTEPDPIAHITDADIDRDERSGAGYARLEVRPCELKEANELVARWHRHHKPVQGHRFSLKAVDLCGIPRGVVVVGRPVARNNDQAFMVEVTRLVTGGTPNVCSLLYATAARAAKEMGYEKIITYILDEKDGGSLRAARWTCEGPAGVEDSSVPSRGGRRVDQPMGTKKRWSKLLRGPK